jgi:hypothetical protein
MSRSSSTLLEIETRSHEIVVLIEVNKHFIVTTSMTVVISKAIHLVEHLFGKLMADVFTLKISVPHAESITLEFSASLKIFFAWKL